MKLPVPPFHINLSTFLDQATGNVPTSSPINKTEMLVPRYNYRRFFELNPLMPLGMLMIICTVIFILVIFRRWPGLIAGIVAGTLTSISVYFLMLALRNERVTYE